MLMLLILILIEFNEHRQDHVHEQDQEQESDRLALPRGSVAYIFQSVCEKRGPVTATSAATVRQKCFVRQQ